MKLAKTITLLMPVVALSACEEGLRPLSDPSQYIAVAADQGFDRNSSANDQAGIAVLPDGCQAWIIDDGVDGRASNRLDPVTGLPVCIGEPGVVYGPYQSSTQGIKDRVPREALPTTTSTVTVMTTEGHFHEVHPVEEPHH